MHPPEIVKRAFHINIFDSIDMSYLRTDNGVEFHKDAV